MAGDIKTQLVVGADVDGATAGIANVKKSLDGLGQAAKKAGDESREGLKGIGDPLPQTNAKVDAATTRIVNSIQRQIAIMEAGSRSGAEYYRVLAGQRGANLDALKPFLDQLDAVNIKQRAAGAALSAGATQFNEYGLSAKQTSAALRQVPAQLTDIVVSLQGGQAPLTVLLQQGGQLRDIFGGVAPAARALGSAVLGLVNPYTILAGVTGAVALAYFNGSKEADEFRRAIVLSGNAVGASTGLLADQARAVSAVVGTQGQAADAIAALAATGRVAFADIAQFGETTIRVQRGTGQAVEETAKQYAALARDPVQAIRKLNEESGLFNVTLLEQVKALIEQGRATDAATLAQRTYDSEIGSRAAGIADNIGLIERAWRGVRDATLGAASAAAGIGRQRTVGEQLSDVRQQLANAEADRQARRTDGRGAFSAGEERALEALRRREEDLLRTDADIRRGAAAQGELTRVQREGFAAEERLSKIRSESATNVQKMAKALTDYRNNLEILRRANPNSPLLDPALIARDEADIRSKFADKGGRGGSRSTGAVDNARLRLDIENIRNAGAALVETYTTSERILESVRATGLLGDREYYEAKRAFITLDAQAKEDAAQKEIDRLQREKATGAAAIENQKKVAEAQARITKARIEAAAQTEVLDNQELGRIRQLTIGYNQARASAEAFLQTLRNQNNRAVAAVGQSDLQRDRGAGISQIEDRYAQQRLQLESDRRQGAYKDREADYARDLALVDEYQAKATASFIDGFDRRLQAQRNWVNGADRGFQNYIDAAADAAGQAERFVTRSFQSMEDALVKFVSTGKLDFKSLANSIIADLIRIQVRAQIAQAAGGGGGGGLFGGLLKLFGAFSGFNPTGDYNALGSLEAGRANGGPVRAYGMNPVVERGDPELLHTRKGTYLLNGSDPGMVQPLSRLPSGGGSGGGQLGVTIINNGTPQRVTGQQQLSNGQIALITEDAVNQAEARILAKTRDPNGSMHRAVVGAFQTSTRR